MTISERLFLVTIAALPIQLGKFFFLDHSYVLGIPIDYRALTFYLSDITIILFTAAAILENRKKIGIVAKTFKPYIVALLIFNFYLILSAVFFSVSREASYFFSSKFFAFSLFSVFAANALQSKNVRGNWLLVLGASVFWQALVIVAQFARQGSIGLQFLGERSFDTGTVQIAHSQLNGREFLRAYGTFPHPNLAAAYLAFSLIILFGEIKSQSKLALTKIIFAAVAILAILLTFSKSAAAFLTLGFLSRVKRLRELLILLPPAAIIAFFVAGNLFVYQIPSIAERLLLSQAALDIALVSPAFGVGSNNFILELASLDLISLSETRLLQPVHNVFLLILAENGIFGLILFATLLLVVSRYLDTKLKLIIFIGVLFYLSVDHFLWTLQQGQLLFWLIIAYIISKPQSKTL